MNGDEPTMVEEYLGDIATETLLKNLTAYNPCVSSIDSLRCAFPQGFCVLAVFKLDRELGTQAFSHFTLEPKYSEGVDNVDLLRRVAQSGQQWVQ